MPLPLQRVQTVRKELRPCIENYANYSLMLSSSKLCQLFCKLNCTAYCFVNYFRFSAISDHHNTATKTAATCSLLKTDIDAKQPGKL
jgi:hypothetical protein